MDTQVITQANPEIKQNINEINIPDLWHIAMNQNQADKEVILEVWHLCHSLRKHIQLNS